MMKHDYKAALEAAEGAFQGYRYMSQDAEVHMEALRYLVKLAAIVTGEPSDAMCEAAILVPVHADIGAWNKEIFKAMIAEAQRQAEGV